MEDRQELQKTLKPHWVWAIALGSAIGWGCFVLPTEWIEKAGPLGAVIGMTVGALLMMLIAISYGFMIEKFPVSGGEFTYAYLGFGRTHSYICGWFLTLGYMCIVAANASALALLGKLLFPAFTKIGFLYEIGGWEVYIVEVLISSAALIIFAFFNIKGAMFSGRLQFIFCVFLVIGVVLLTISMVMHPAAGFENAKPLFNPDVPIWTGLIAIIAIAPFAYVGFDNVPQAAEEFDFAPKKAFMLIIFSLIFAGILYSFMIFATAFAKPWQELVSQKTVWGTADAISGTLGMIGTIILAVSLCMGVLTGLNGFYVSSSRLLFAMGRARVLPKAFTTLHPQYQTPYVALLFTCVICLLAPWFGRQVLLWIVDMSSVGVAIAYGYTCLAAYRLFKWKDDGTFLIINGKTTYAVSPVRKLSALVGTVVSIVFLLMLLLPSSPAALGKPSLIALAAWIGIGIVFYLFKAKEFLSIPKEKLDYFILGSSVQQGMDHNEGKEAVGEMKGHTNISK